MKQKFKNEDNTRRSFLKKTALGTVLLSATDLLSFGSGHSDALQRNPGEVPWYKNVTRWGQVNITEKDPAQYDIGWWRKFWERTETRGVIINAGGIVAYYPTKVPLHRTAEFLAGRDLFGDLCRAAHEDGLAVFARMDSNRAHEEFYTAHPGWFAEDVSGKPYKAGDLYITCINSPYYNEHIPAILKELIELYHPEGFTDNSWSGLDRESICYCEFCRKGFHDKTGFDLPADKNWNNKEYRQWIRWNYDRRLEIWDLNNRVTKSAGGVHCIWSGMNSGLVSGQSRNFRDYKEICTRAEIIMLDDQARSDSGGFQHNGEIGKMIHGMLGWDKLVPESMAMYQAGRPTFRLASKPAPEARMWMLNGIAGGIQPWWHMVSAFHEDHRMYQTPGPVMKWHKANGQFLINRKPVATIGLVWSQQNNDFYGRDNVEELVELPWRGMAQALIRARIPYVPVHIDHVDRDSTTLSVLVLPNLAAMSESQAAGIRRFVEHGGSLVATGVSSLFNEWGDMDADYALADLFGAHFMGAGEVPSSKLAGEAYHTYLRLMPGLAGMPGGPKNDSELTVTGRRHKILDGFDETAILPFGGLLHPLNVDTNAEVLMTYIPQFPVYPPETAWMLTSKTDIPGLIINITAKGSRVSFLPADIDRQFARYNLPDHGNLLANIVRWAAKDDLPMFVEGAGLVDCHLYEQADRMVLHIVNLTSAATWRQPLDELISIGPLHVKIRLSKNVRGNSARSLVSDEKISSELKSGWSHFVIKSVLDHEVIIIT